MEIIGGQIKLCGNKGGALHLEVNEFFYSLVIHTWHPIYPCKLINNINMQLSTPIILGV